MQITETESEPGAEPEYDLASPEDVVISVIDGAHFCKGLWPNYQIEGTYVIKGGNGAASAEWAHGGFLDYTIEEMVDEPKEPGFYVIEGITATFHKGEWGFTEDEFEFAFQSIRPATPDEVAEAGFPEQEN